MIHTISIWKKCNLLRKTRVHLVLPRNQDLTCGDDTAAIEIWYQKLTRSGDFCNHLPNATFYFNVERKKCLFTYPYNVMRNTARHLVETSHLFVIDVDILPSPNTMSEFWKAVSSIKQLNNTNLTAFVIPTFEIIKEQRFPQNKNELKHLIQLGKMRVFHEKTCTICHKNTR